MARINQKVRYYYATVKKKIKIPAAQSGGTSTTETRTIGVICSSSLNFAKFLDIPDTAAPVPAERISAVAGSTRTLVTASGGEGTSAVREYERGIPMPKGRAGSKRVTLFTGKPTSTGSKRTHTISILVPSIMGLRDIAEFLGEIIPLSKIKADPGATDIKPFFKVEGGGKFPIAAQGTAEASPAVDVPASPTEAAAAADLAKQGTGR